MLESHFTSGCGLPMCKTNRHHEALTFLQDSCCSHRVKVGEREENMASDKLPPGTIPWFSTNSVMLCTHLEFSGAVSVEPETWSDPSKGTGTLYALQPQVGRKRGWQEGRRGGKEKKMTRSLPELCLTRMADWIPWPAASQQTRGAD